MQCTVDDLKIIIAEATIEGRLLRDQLAKARQANASLLAENKKLHQQCAELLEKLDGEQQSGDTNDQ